MRRETDRPAPTRSPQAAVLAGGSTPATPATPKESRGAARQAFERFDADRSGTLSKDECLAFIDDTGFYGITRGYLDGVWSVYDRNADGALDFKEFSTFYTVLAQRSQKRQTQAPAPEPEPENSSGVELGPAACAADPVHADKFPNCVESPAGSGSFDGGGGGDGAGLVSVTEESRLGRREAVGRPARLRV